MQTLPAKNRGRLLGVLALGLFVVVGSWISGTWGDSGSVPAQVGGAPLCDPRFCGDGNNDPGEQCDDGNSAPGDGCDPLCRIECTEDLDCPSGQCSGGVCTNLCGNGIVDPAVCSGSGSSALCSLAEECDDGIQNGQPGKCSIRCTLCGNGTVDAGEQCDDANLNPDDGCSATCKREFCGDGVVNGTEECDEARVCISITGNSSFTCFYNAQANTCQPATPTDIRVLQQSGITQFPLVCTTQSNIGAPTCAGNVCVHSATCTDQCTTIGQCNLDAQCTADESCQCLDCIGASRCDACNNNNQCDNGESCSCGDCASEPSCQTHAACDPVTQQCISVSGAGTNDCTDTQDCTRTQRLKCVNQACTVVQESGMDLCGADIDCLDSQHRQCNLFFQTCELVDGAAEDQCADDGECANLTLACVDEQCVVVEGTDFPTCAVSAECRPACNFDGQCSADESCQCLDCIGDIRCNACNGNNQCEAGESCSCGDCQGEPSCRTHTECDHVHQQCVLVPGDGSNDCTEYAADCTNSERLKCVNQACTIVQESGVNLCENDADCCDPADPSCVHEQCNHLFQTCEVVSGPGRDFCPDCGNFTLACVGEQCAVVAGTDFPSCTTSAECVQSQCGDGVVDLFEQCDSGEQNGVWQGNECRYMLCNADCTLPRCGDGNLNACTWTSGIYGGEECDRGSLNGQPGSLCSTQCTDVEIVCNLDAQCSADESCQCLDCIGAGRCSACNNNNVCEAGESCACNDCGDMPSCLAHTECDAESKQCVVRLGEGVNRCFGDEECTAEEHLECQNMACTPVPGGGLDLCETSDDCCDPADPACVHRQCNPFTQSCLTQQGPAPDDCASGVDCTAYHSECGDAQCLLVEGEGDPECLDASQCGGAFCGDSKVDEGEDCDEGPNNRTTEPDDLESWYCKAGSCTFSACNDGGDNDSDGLPDAFDAGCWEYDLTGVGSTVGFRAFFARLLAQAGDILDPIPPERLLAGKDDEACPAVTVDRGSFCALRCDPGDICPGGGVCPEDGECPNLCPNGVIDTVLGITEECDDGNLINDDFCSNICRLNDCLGPDCPRCGDGIPQPEIGEQCDDGNANNEDTCTTNCRIRCEDDDDCQGRCDLTTHQCLPSVCGDGVVNQVWERCDDGNTDHEDTCNNQCQPTCHGNADCESGKCDMEQLVCVPLCGNGRYDSGEQCDDGNLVNNDTCTNQCERTCTDSLFCDCDEERGVCRKACGNGRLDIGEQCDDGNTVDRDACNNQCRIRCQPGTLCPDNQACPQNGLCLFPAVCGDGIVNGAEQCDDANANETDGCTNACTIRCSQNVACPNGLVCAGESCVECSSSLQCLNGFCVDGRCRPALPICGNSVVEPGESCDDGNFDSGDACASNCAKPIGAACDASAQCTTRLCTDGICQPCANEGQCGSGLRCSEGNCLFGPLSCGDGIVQGGEACDDANLNEQDQCTSACLRAFGAACANASQCQSGVCASGVCSACRSDLECSVGLRCALGMCLSDDQLARYPNVCGNGIREGDEACDDGNTRFGDGCTPTCDIGNAPVRSEVAANIAVQLPFTPAGQGLHASALTDTGPATVAVMAAGAAAGTAWIRRRRTMRR